MTLAVLGERSESKRSLFFSAAGKRYEGMVTAELLAAPTSIVVSCVAMQELQAELLLRTSS